jgi:hypothetical protein
MQKYILSLIILLFQVQVFAQKLSISVVFDPQVTWMKCDSRYVENEGARFGFNTGLLLDAYFAENYAFSTGAFIWRTGGKLELVDPGGFNDPSGFDTLAQGTTINYKLQYISVPLSLKLKSNQIGYNTFFTHLGINIHMNIRALAEVPGMNISDEDVAEEIQFFMSSYFFGGGLEYSLGGNTALMAGLYFENGFMDVKKTKDYKVYIGSVSIRLGIKF